MKIELLVESSLDLKRIYLLNRVADVWRSRGHDVGVRRLHEPPGEPDVSILHVDRSRIAPAAVEVHLRSGRPVLNAGALDITKRRVSRLLVGPDDDWEGPVIVKTDLNYWGQPERQRDGPPGLPRRILERLQRSLPWKVGRRLPVESYPVLPGVDAVPVWLWRSETYVVERFVPERDGDLYVTRYWVFLGEQEFVFTKRTSNYIVKRGDAVEQALSEEVPDVLRRRRRELGFDFGKFDWVLVDGTPMVFDANKTPALIGLTDTHPHLLEILADGLEPAMEEASGQSRAGGQGRTSAADPGDTSDGSGSAARSGRTG